MTHQNESNTHAPNDAISLCNSNSEPSGINFYAPPNDTLVLRIDKYGMTYKGTLIEDTGEAYAALMCVMGQMGYQKPLTDEEIKELGDRHLDSDNAYYMGGTDGITGWLEFARAVLKGRA